eukprot:CAMPEP_0170840752 /NCGR_PEP_ID=MMETSP0734-20130129/4761_1 /TAXON_ID=186038 /ORGANISM="Fragilariopsis kerguelensis, Strain L26-C5" /LENGTH=716 /DNA_ID=CAMNT_0011208613 /DNA_START=29 /DNA_END=2179 /DNA_ORIENTATION=-
MGKDRRWQERNYGGGGGGGRTKRKFQRSNREEQETVDDLAYAGQFAMIHNVNNTVITATILPENQSDKNDGNEIEVDADDDDDDDCSGDSIADKSSSDNDDDDDESDMDLAEAVRKMDQATEEEDEFVITSSNPPKTENEVDAYKVPIQELESQLQIQLTVQKGTLLSSSSSPSSSTLKKTVGLDYKKMAVAGKIRDYMITDRTVVVESLKSSLLQPNTMLGGCATGPLAEGSLLVIQIQPSLLAGSKGQEKDNSADINDDDDNPGDEMSLIPLGRIFEVFGPVSQPLYTIRLPSPSSSAEKKISSKKANKRNSNKKRGNNRRQHQKGNSVDENKILEVVDDNDKEDETNIHNNQRIETTTTTSVTVNNESIEEIMTCITTNQHEEKNLTKDKKPASVEENVEILSPSSPKADSTIIKEEIGIIEKEVISISPSLSLSNMVEKSSPINQGGNQTSEAHDTTSDLTLCEKDVSVVHDDPWAINGKYAMFLSQNQNIEVYYIQDEAKLIDTSFIMRSSGKGCDASNVYDEEVLNSNDLYYSDDEKERDAKNKKKGGGTKKKQQRNRQQQQQSKPENYHHRQQQDHNSFIASRFPNVQFTRSAQFCSSQSPPPPHMAQYGVTQSQYSNLPEGFHNMAPPHRPRGVQPYSSLQYAGQFQGQTSAPPPPFIPPPPIPPPPPGYYHPNSNQAMNSVPTQRMSTIPPPPPPPRNPNEPPAYQY